MIAFLRILAATTLFGACPLAAQQSGYILELEYETATERHGELGGSSSSGGRQAIVERVLAATPRGVEIEYSIPDDPEDVRGNGMWMFPARIRVASDGGKSVLNSDELNSRVDQWLALGEWTRDECGQWHFTWTAHQVRCDIEAVIDSVETFGMRPGYVAEGELIALPGAVRPAPLRRAGTRGERAILVGDAPVDSEELRRQTAETAVVVSGLMGEAKTIDEAMTELAEFNATGTIKVELEVDKDGLVWRREDTTEITVTGLESGDETRHARQTVTRSAIEGSSDLQGVE